MKPTFCSPSVIGTLTVLVWMAKCDVAVAQSAPAITYVQATNAACKVGRPSVKSDELVTWQGKCNDGLATGPGVAQWSSAGKPTLRYEGTFEKGLLEGTAVMTGAEGDRYEGPYKGGLRHGFGIYVQGNGARYQGEFRNNQRASAASAASQQAALTPATSPQLEQGAAAKTQSDQRSAQQTEQAGRAKQAAERDGASKAQFMQFVKKHNLVEKVVKGLSANPFSFEGQNLLIPSGFEQMQNATAGLFYVPDEGVIMVTDIPKGTFAAKGRVLLAGKVIGNTPFDGVVGGLLPVKGMIPSVKYLGVLICASERCSEMTEK